MNYGEFEPNRIKHMEMIQAVISRLGGNGFLVKGWAITIAAAFSGFALNLDNSPLAASGLVSALVFWNLDAHFLRSERLFRALFDQVRSGDDEIRPFFMGATTEEFVKRVKNGSTECPPETASWLDSAKSPTVFRFYSVIAALTTLVIIVTACTDAAAQS